MSNRQQTCEGGESANRQTQGDSGHPVAEHAIGQYRRRHSNETSHRGYDGTDAATGIVGVEGGSNQDRCARAGQATRGQDADEPGSVPGPRSPGTG
jgi:hypothetical protein